MSLNISILLQKAMKKNIFKKPIKNIEDLVYNSEIIEENLNNSVEKLSINVKENFNIIEEQKTKINITNLLREKMIMINK